MIPGTRRRFQPVGVGVLVQEEHMDACHQFIVVGWITRSEREFRKDD